MRILAYTDKRYLRATLEVVGEEADVLISPPLKAGMIMPLMLEGYDFVYLDLHGVAGEGTLYSRGREETTPALLVETVRKAFLLRTVIFAVSCYLPETPFIQAFLDAGARAVVAGEGENYGKVTRICGAQMLAKNMIRYLEEGRIVEEALREGKRKIGYFVRVFDKKSTQDSLAFKIYEMGKEVRNG